MLWTSPLLAAVDQPPATAAAVVKAHLRAHVAELGLQPADVADVVVTSDHVSEASGVTHVYLRQRLRGIEVFGGEMNVNLGRDLSVLSLDHSFVPGLATAAKARVPARDAAAAATAAARALGLDLAQPIAVMNKPAGPARETTLTTGAISVRPIPAKLVYLPVPPDLRLSWLLEIEPPGGQHLWSVVVDAQTLEVLKTIDHVAEGGGTVAPAISPGPPGGT
jgi:hypothetical protein